MKAVHVGGVWFILGRRTVASAIVDGMLAMALRGKAWQRGQA